MFYKDNSELKFCMKLKVFNETHAFGPGVVKILELVSETNSLSASYKAMDISSSKGWKIIKRAEEDLGFPLIQSSIGGKGGGYSTVTEEGKELLHRYNIFVKELDIEAERLFKKHFTQ